MFELKVKSDFSAAHKLSTSSGKCESLHGHNWEVELSVMGVSLNKSGMLIDFSILKKYLSIILNKLDHKFLNELTIFNNMNPSSENIALFIAKEIQKKITTNDLSVKKVTVWESKGSSASYITKS